MKKVLAILTLACLFFASSVTALGAENRQPAIKDVIYSNPLGAYIVQFDSGLISDVFIKVFDQYGILVANSPALHPENSFWTIPSEGVPQSGMRIELQDKDGKVLAFQETPGLSKQEANSPWVESFLDVKDNQERTEVLYAVYAIPEDYKNPRLIWQANGKAGICSVTPGAIYAWEITGKNLILIILDGTDVGYAYDAFVTHQEGFPYLNGEEINSKSPGVREIVDKAIPLK